MNACQIVAHQVIFNKLLEGLKTFTSGDEAHEYMNFILFFSIPVFYDLMPIEYFQHLLLLIISLENLLCKKINRRNLLIDF